VIKRNITKLGNDTDRLYQSCFGTVKHLWFNLYCEKRHINIF